MASLYDLFVSISGDSSSFKQSMKESSDSLGGFAEFAVDAGKKIAGALALAELAKSAFEAAEKYTDASNQIQRATGATGVQLANLTGAMRELYGESAQSESAIAGALSEIAIKSGLTGAALKELTQSSLNFAKVTGQDVGGAVQTNAKLFAEWNITAQDQSFAMDMLTAGWQHAGGTMQGFTSSLAATTLTLKSAGFSFEDSVALIANFTKHGIDAEQIVRGLDTAMRKWAAAGEDPRAMLDRLIARMESAKTSTDALALAQDAGLGRSSKVMVQAVQDGVFRLDGLKTKLDAAKGSTDALAKSTTTFGAEMTKLWHTFENFAVDAAGPFVEFLTKSLEKTLELNKAFAELEKQAIDWASKKGLFDVVGPIGNALNNTFNPWASGNYINLLKNPPAGPNAPKLPGAPTPASLAYGSATTNTGGGQAPDLPGWNPKALPFGEASDEAAVWVAELKQAQAQHKATIDDIARSGLTIQQYFTNKMIEAGESVKRADDTLAPAAKGFGDVAQMASDAGKELSAIGVYGKSPVQQLQDAYHELGLTMSSDFNSQAESAKKAYDFIKGSGVATAREVGDAWMKMQLAQLEADHAQGVVDDQLYQQRKKNIEDTLKLEQGEGKVRQTLNQQIASETKRLSSETFSSIERGIAADIVKWKGFGQTVKDVFSKLGTDALQIMLHALLAPVEQQFAALAVKIASKIAGMFITTKVTASAADMAEIAGNAAVAASATFASIAAIPIVGPGLAPAAAAASYAEVMAMVPLAAFKFGGDVPFDMPAFLHAQEMVLPSDIAVPLRRSLAGGGQLAPGGGSAGIAFHNCNFGQSSMSHVVRELRLAGARI